MLSEEEIISRIKHLIYTLIEERKYSRVDIEQIKIQEAIEGLLDLYQKEKAKNKKYQGIENGTTIIFKAKAKYVREDRIEKYYIDKNKIREKIEMLEDVLDLAEEDKKFPKYKKQALKEEINDFKELLGE